MQIGVVDSKLTQIHKKIERILTTEDNQEKDIELNLALDSLIYRFGTSGKQRKTNINEGYRLTLSIMLPLVSRYFLWTAKQRQHIYAIPGSTSPHESWFSEIRQIIQSNCKDHLDMIMSKRERIVKIQQRYAQCILNMRRVKGLIEKVAEGFENQFVQMRDILTPVQCAKLIFFIQKCKYWPEVRLMNQGQIQDPQIEAFNTRKYLKIEQKQQE